MNYLIYIGIALATMLMSALTTKWLIGYLIKKGILDNPNHRSSHTIPTPRGGGLAIVLSFAVALLTILIIAPSTILPGKMFFIGLLLVALVGFLDDKLNFSATFRFGVQIIAAALVIIETGGLHYFPLPGQFEFALVWLGYPLTLLWILGVLNIYNFLDGIDGHATTQAVLAGIFIMVLDLNGPGFIIGLLVASASLGFLFFNWHKAKVFMGDVGSVSLGYIFATIPFYFGEMSADNGVFAIVIVLWFFLSDGSFTIIRRLLNGEKIWQAHRSHLYQRLVIAGFSHAKVVSIVMFGAILLSATYLYLYFIEPMYLPFIIALALIMFLAYIVWVILVEKSCKQSDN